MRLGERISQYRRSLGISQEELGARLGVSRQAVSKWETGAATPDMANLMALAREFGVSVAELTETPEPKKQKKLLPEFLQKKSRRKKFPEHLQERNRVWNSPKCCWNRQRKHCGNSPARRRRNGRSQRNCYHLRRPDSSIRRISTKIISLISKTDRLW